MKKIMANNADYDASEQRREHLKAKFQQGLEDVSDRHLHVGEFANKFLRAARYA
jgi:hypothetical protein